MNCNNQACLFAIDSKCTSDLHEVTPSKAPINVCKRFLEEGLQWEDEFAIWFEIDPVGCMDTLNKKEMQQYCDDLTFVRNRMHLRTL